MPAPFPLLERLCNAYGVSGDEGPVRALIQKEIAPYVDTATVDKMGNLICRQKGKKFPVLLVAHMDEIGLMVKRISESGHIYFSLLGGMNEDSLLGQRVHIKSRKGYNVHGVVTYEAMHVGRGQPENFPAFTDMYVDTGLSKKELEKAGITTGSYMIPEKKLGHLGNPAIVSGKALDDRIGCAILIELARRMKKVKTGLDVYYVFTVQEEMGLYGAKTSIYHIEPEWAVIVEATDSPDFLPSDTGIGRGPSITVKDAEFISNKCLRESLIHCAKRRKIPYQLEVSDFGTTDALDISLSKGGIQSAVVSVSVRNLHTTVSIAHLRDIEQTVLLLEALLKNPPKLCTHH